MVLRSSMNNFPIIDDQLLESLERVFPVLHYNHEKTTYEDWVFNSGARSVLEKLRLIQLRQSSNKPSDQRNIKK